MEAIATGPLIGLWRRVAADKDGRMRLLQRLGEECVILEAPGGAIVRHALLGPEAADYTPCLLEAGARRVVGNLHHVEVVRPDAAADAEVQPAAGKQIDR